MRVRSRRGARSRLRAAAALAAVLAAGALGACKPPYGDPMALGRSIEPFRRLPYVQAVDTAEAWVLWKARAAAVDSLLYRVDEGVEDGEWRRAPVERLPREGVAPDSFRTRRAWLTGLGPDRAVTYRAFADGTGTPPVTFRTAPRPSSPDPVRVLAFGDSGWGSRVQVRLAERMEEMEWDLAVHTGDIAYQSGREREFTVRHFHVYRDLLGRVPFFPSPGDHDLRTDGGAPYDRAFRWPAPREGARYYAFTWGAVRFLSLESSDETAVGLRLRQRRGEQYRWLRAALDSAAADPAVRWTVVYTHSPPYSHAVGLSGHGSDFALRRALTPLFDRYGVDLVLSGHDHHYERSHPLLDGERVPAGCGPVYVVTGGGGASRYARSVSPSSRTARISRDHHFLRLVLGRERIEGEAIDAEGRTLDSFRVLPYPSWEEVGPGCEA